MGLQSSFQSVCEKSRFWVVESHHSTVTSTLSVLSVDLVDLGSGDCSLESAAATILPYWS